MLRVTTPPAGIEHAWYKYYVFVRPERLGAGWDPDRILAQLSAAGLPAFSGSCSEIYRCGGRDHRGCLGCRRPRPPG